MTHTNMRSAVRPSSLVSLLLGMLLVGLAPLSFLTSPVHAQQDSGPDDQQKAMHYSLYYESFKNNEFADAKKDLKWVLENAPGYPKGDDRNYRRHYELYKGLAENAADSEKRTAYLDTAATILTSAVSKLKKKGLSYEEYEWEVRKGRFLQEHEDALSKLGTDGLEDPATHYRKAFDLAPKELNPYYIRQVLRSYQQNNEQQKALDFIETVESKRGDDEEVAQILSSVRDNIFGKNPQAQVKYLEKQLEANPDSAKVMQSLFDAYVDMGNIKKASELAPRLMKTNPTAETVRQIAKMRLEDGRPEAAIKAYNKATEQGAELKAEDYFNRGSAYQQLKEFPKARKQYQKALEMKPEFGKAYVAIGDLYARAVNECSGSELSRDDKAVYWAVVDKYRQATDVDSSLKSVVKSKIRSYRKVFPTQEDIFYRDDWDKGQSFRINYGCYSWIGETTTVRQAP